MSSDHEHGDHKHDGMHSKNPHAGHATHAGHDQHHDQRNHHHAHHGHHGHHHHHHVTKNIGVAFWLNFAFCLIEFVGAYLTNSLSIFSDALHDLGDSFALGFAYFFEKKSRKLSDAEYSYGYRRWSVLSALLTGILISVGAIAVIWSCFERIRNPQTVIPEGMIALAMLGVLVNGAAFFRLKDGHSLNEKMIRWHFVEDITGWVAVLCGAIAIYLFEIPVLDSVLALGLSAWVLWNVFRNLRSTLDVLLQKVPAGLSSEKIRNELLRNISSVKDCHHTHVWSVDGESHIVTLHLVVEQMSMDDLATLKARVRKLFREKFAVSEVTMEFEYAGEKCEDPHHH